MMDLKLLQKLQATEMVTLILKVSPGGVLDYFIVSKTINYSIVATGRCEGVIESEMRSFNILLSGLMPMVEKGHKFRIVYDNEVLRFISSDDRIVLTPLCVEYNDEHAVRIIEKYLRYSDALDNDQQLATREENLAHEISSKKRSYSELRKMALEGDITSSNPFSESSMPAELDSRYSQEIAQLQQDLENVQQKKHSLEHVSMKEFRQIALAASRAHEMISFCGEFAVMELKSSYILQKVPCRTMAMHGTLLHQLLQFDENGFYWFENGLVFETGTENKTVVFVEKYLPNTTVDASIVTRGVVLEKYIINIKGNLSVAQLMRGRFPDMTFDLSESKILLENDKGETLVITLGDVKPDSLGLRKAMREMAAGSSEITQVNLSSVTVPKEIQSLLGLFREEITLYVKKRKIIFQGGNLYFVFGRQEHHV